MNLAKKFLLIFFIFFIGGIIFFFKNKNLFFPADNSFPLEEEEYEVYSYIINSLYVDEQTKLVVISQKIEDLSTENRLDKVFDLNLIKRDFPEVQPETLENFESKGQKVYFLKRNLQLKVDYVLLSEKESQDIKS